MIRALLSNEPIQSSLPVCLDPFPWIENPYRPVNWLDMFRVGATWLIGIEQCFSEVLQKLNSVAPEMLSRAVPSSDLRWVFEKLIEYFATVLSAIGTARLPVTTQVLKDLEFLYKNDKPTWLDLRNSINSLKTCYEAELKAMAFFGISERFDYFEKPLERWTQVVDRFGCGDDIEEAGKCIAMARFTASVFHVMRVVERGVLELQIFLKGTPDLKAHFGGVLSKLEDMVQKTRYEHIPPHLQPYLPFMRDVLPQLHAVKDAWRDKVAHVDNKIVPVEQFNEEKAMEVYETSLALMKKLADSLP